MENKLMIIEVKKLSKVIPPAPVFVTIIIPNVFKTICWSSNRNRIISHYSSKITLAKSNMVLKMIKLTVFVMLMFPCGPGVS